MVEARKVVIAWVPSPEGHPHAGARDWWWACSVCELVYEKQTDAQNCCAEVKKEKGMRWRSLPEGHDIGRAIARLIDGRLRPPWEVSSHE